MSYFIKKMREAIEHVDAARQIMASGPLDFYFEKLVSHSDALLTRFTPVKAGEEAVIVEKVPCTDGWRGSERDLAVGQLGLVKSVDYRSGQFFFEFVPHQQWWQDGDGVYHVKERRSSYNLREKYLQRVTRESAGGQ